ncbi:DUF202 domain-containing protein, partial [Streptomyces sp. NPDC051098]|uniref:DUF202 domain-containing protein n=1 Tax=Streptomyces sp. NPDC051098 TaxID=3155411 RepID=UPI003432588B
MTALPERDPGLQPERTRLAWRRTTLSFTVAAVLAARQAAGGDPGPAGLIAVALSVLVWLVFLRLAHVRLDNSTVLICAVAAVLALLAVSTSVLLRRR